MAIVLTGATVWLLACESDWLSKACSSVKCQQWMPSNRQMPPKSQIEQMAAKGSQSTCWQRPVSHKTRFLGGNELGASSVLHLNMVTSHPGSHGRSHQLIVISHHRPYKIPQWPRLDIAGKQQSRKW